MHLTAKRLYETHNAALVAYARRVTGDRAHADDLVQDAWLLLDRVPNKTAIRDPSAYLRRIIRNLAIDVSRRRTREGGIVANPEAALSAVTDGAPSPEDAAIAREEAQIVLDAIERMDDRQKAAMKLYYFEGLKLREVALRLGVSRSTVHTLVLDGLAICDSQRSGG